MGTTVDVSSTTYNMAGNVSDRPDYLKSLVVRNILSGTKDSMGQTIINGMLKGPQMKLKAWYRWCNRPGNYDHIGMPTGEISSSGTINYALLQEEMERLLPVADADNLEISAAEIGYGQYLKWAEQYVFFNEPAQWNQPWQADWNGTVITINYEDSSEQNDVFTPLDFDTNMQYIYAYYRIRNASNVLGPRRLWIYRIGSGGSSSLDDLNQLVIGMGEFFPIIPMRIANKFITDPVYEPQVTPQVAKAYKKLTGKHINTFLSKLNENPNIADIDHAYIVMGVPVNIVDNSAKAYIYAFFKQLSVIQEVGQPNVLAITSRTPTFNYDFRISWDDIHEGHGQGQGRPGANPGDYWFTSSPHVRLFRQIDANNYSYLHITNMFHDNFAYPGKSIRLSLAEAVGGETANTKEGGFIVPLHYETFSKLNLRHSAQMSSVCVVAVFNSVVVKKTSSSWWNSGFFRILLIVVVSVATAVFTGGTSLGLLGTAIGIGTSLGLSGMSAIIIGAVVNAVAAVALMSILEKVAVGIFGEQFGPMIAMLAMIVIGNIAGAYHSSGQLTLNWNDFLKADNLLKLTDAVGTGIQNHLNAQTMKLGAELQDFLKAADLEASKIQQAFFDTFGYGAGKIDPFMFVDSANIRNESSATFLTRTLMTGSEIADMSHELLYNFAEYSNKLPDAFT